MGTFDNLFTTTTSKPKSSTQDPFSGLFSPKKVEPGTPGSGVTKSGINVSSHAFNPLNSTGQQNLDNITKGTTTSLAQNFKSSIFPAAKQVGNYLGDTAAQIVAPGITHDELRNPQIIKDTLTGIPTAIGQLTKQAATHPIDSAQTAVANAARGISDVITTGIINVFVPKADREGTKTEVNNILNKYLDISDRLPKNKATEAIGQGFKSAGNAAPFVAAGGIAGESGVVLGSASTSGLEALSRGIGTTAGFLGAGQTQVPLEADIKERSTRIMNDLIGLGLFEAGSNIFGTVKAQVIDAVTKSLSTPKPIPEGVPTEFPSSDPTGKTTPLEIPKVETEFPKSEAHAVPIKGETPIEELNQSKNSLATDRTGEKPGGIERATAEIQSGNKPPVKIRTLEDGSKFIEDGRHHLQAATDLGLKSYPIEDVTSKYETPEIKTSKLSSGVEQKAIEAGLTKGFEGKPEYATVDVKKQAEAALNLIAKDPERAQRIAMGNERPPEGLLPESVFTAVENEALKNGDVSTLRDLATSSSLTSEATGMGQRIRMLAERNPDSAVAQIQDVIKAREEKASKTTKDLSEAKKTGTEEIKKEITKTHTKETWSSFVESLKC